MHPCVTADRERIKQVLTNLITNAIKYSPQADRIIIVGLSTYTDSGQARVSVEDFGIGVPESEQRSIFNRSFQVALHRKRSRPGTLFRARLWIIYFFGDYQPPRWQDMGGKPCERRLDLRS